MHMLRALIAASLWLVACSSGGDECETRNGTYVMRLAPVNAACGPQADIVVRISNNEVSLSDGCTGSSKSTGSCTTHGESECRALDGSVVTSTVESTWQQNGEAGYAAIELTVERDGVAQCRGTYRASVLPR